MLRADQQAGARPVDTSLQMTALVGSGEDEVWVALGWMGEAEAVDEMRAAVVRARNLEAGCMVVDVFGRRALRSLLNTDEMG